MHVYMLNKNTLGVKKVRRLEETVLWTNPWLKDLISGKAKNFGYSIIIYCKSFNFCMQ